jgi:hypothetical protein
MKSKFKMYSLVILTVLLLCVGVAFATITSLPVVTPVGPYISGQPTANSLNFVFTACDSSNGNSFPLSGKETLLVFNSDSMAHTFTITSVADRFNRSQDVTAYSVGAGLYSSFSFRGDPSGWLQPSDSKVHLLCSDATIKFAVLTSAN